MSAAKLWVLALTGLAAAMLIKQCKSDWLPPLRVCLTVLLALGAVGAAEPLISYLRELSGGVGLSQYTAVLVKALGVAVLTQCCSETCRASGEDGLAGGVELVGKIEILLLSLPLMRDILQIASAWLTPLS